MPLRCAFERGRSLPWKSQGTLCFLVGCDLDRSATLVNARPRVGPSPRLAPSPLWTELWARCEEIVQFQRNYAQEFQFLRQFCIVAPFNSREHLLARESAGYRRCGPLPRASVRRRSSLEGWELSGSWSARDAAVFEEASVSSGLVRPAFGPAAARCSGPRAGDRPGSGRFLRELPRIGRCASRGPGADSLFGGWPSGTGSRVALQILAFGGKVPVELRLSPFRQRPLPFPVLGSWPIRDRAGSARTLREGLDRSRKVPARALTAAREATSQEAACRRP